MFKTLLRKFGLWLALYASNHPDQVQYLLNLAVQKAAAAAQPK